MNRTDTEPYPQNRKAAQYKWATIALTMPFPF